jgi:ABC-type nitrate/sulfonate/bicarbonate transport system substrate-binding protein
VSARKTLTTWLCALVLATLLVAPRPVGAQELTTITIASVTNDTCSAILYAMKLGLFAKAGLNVDFQPMTSGAAASAAVAGGAAQFGLSSLVTLIDAHTRGVPFTLVAGGGLITSDSLYAAALVRKDSPIATAADLSGKTFAGAERSQSDRCHGVGRPERRRLA